MSEPRRAMPQRRNPLRLRRPAEIALAYVLGPTAGLTVLWVLMLAGGALFFRDGFSGIARLSLAFFYMYLLIFGGLVCLVVELIVITPLLMGFHRYRWRWLNGWTGALIGFLLAFAPAMLIIALAPARAGHARPDLLATVLASAVIGVVGLTTAAVFRLLAVRRADGEP